MSDWTEKYSSLELLESLKDDLEMLYDVEFNVDADNIDASLHVVNALMKRLENLPIPHDN